MMMTAAPITTTPQNLASKALSKNASTRAATKTDTLPTVDMPPFKAERTADAATTPTSTLTMGSVSARSIE